MSSSPRILNVDDDEIGRFTVTQMLRSAGFDVDEAVNGADALAKAELLPDLILLDVRMPDMDGFEVCRRIKANPLTAGITVLHLSATQIDAQAIAHGLNWGADGYLTEPIGQAELVATIRAFLRIRRAEAGQRFLAHASRELSSVLDPDEVLARLAALAVSFFGELCVVDKLKDDGTLCTLTVLTASTAGGMPRLLPYFPRRFVEGPEPGVLAVARSGKAAHTTSIDERARLSALLGLEDPSLLDDLLPCSFASVPLIARHRTLGVLSIVSRGQRFGSHDLGLLEDLAVRSALQVDNARLYEQAQRAIATRESLLAVVSHDLKDPLGNVVMSCELLAETATDDSTRRRIEIMRRSAQRMDHLIHDLLDLASLDRGTLSIDRAEVALPTLINEVQEMFAPQATEKSIELQCSVASGLPLLSCDRGRLHQVLSNLLSNALKFTPQGGRVQLQVHEASGQIVFAVIDTGPGILSEQMPYLFDRFWQASRSGRVGTGLGLSIAKGIVEAHGGVIAVRSAPGAGSTFEFKLPLGLS
jgi:signal transduction histidine kinase/FixJ family two-component response regulator